MLDLRGLASRFTAAGLAVRSFPFGLKGAAIDLARLDSDFPYLLDMPHPERHGEAARGQGARAWRGNPVAVRGDRRRAGTTMRCG